MKIGILGTHGVGKTTIASKLFTHCTQRSKNVRMIHEVVRDCPFGLHDAQSIDTVSWITAKQIGLELDAKAKGAEIIICDRTSIDPMMYLYAKSGVGCSGYAQKLSEMAHAWLETYDALIFVRPSGDEITPDGFRNVDLAFQKAVDLEFEISLGEYAEVFPIGRLHVIDSDYIFNSDHTNFFTRLLEVSHD
jgi:GTPase SAR1 family protein